MTVQMRIISKLLVSRALRTLAAILICALGEWGSASAQLIEVREAEPLIMPGRVDSNSPAVWHDGQLLLFNSANVPFVAVGRDAQDVLRQPSISVFIDNFRRTPLWFEAAYLRADGSIYAWYHHEVVGLCPDSDLSVPVIGAMVSRDGGLSFEDLGIVLAPGYPLSCNALNGYFAGGHGDFTVIPDREGRYFYFYFGNYGGPPEEQGIAVARLAFEDLDNPAGKVMKYFEGAWDEPGLGGRVTPVLPVSVPWQSANTDAFWGPAIHWNAYLEQYVMLLNRSCCEPGWPQEGVYISFNPEISNPDGWTFPAPVFRAGEVDFQLDWYPQVLGMEEGETDTVAGKKARLFLRGASLWEIEFHRAEP